MCYDLLLDDDLPPFPGIHLVDSDTESETASETESSEEEDEDSVASPLDQDHQQSNSDSKSSWIMFKALFFSEHLLFIIGIAMAMLPPHPSLHL